MKAISPLIAVVLLIAFTVSIGAILNVWLGGMVKTTAGGVETKQEKTLLCSGVSIDIEEVKQDPTNAVNDTFIIYNPSKYEIKQLTLFADGVTIPFNITIASNELRKLSWNITQSFSFVRFTGFCLGEIPVKGDCEPGFVCWKE